MKKDLIQIRNPRTLKWIKIDIGKGIIVSHGRTKIPYKHIPIYEEKSWLSRRYDLNNAAIQEQIKESPLLKIIRYRKNLKTQGIVKPLFKSMELK